jgi:hypothetical protein
MRHRNRYMARRVYRKSRAREWLEDIAGLLLMIVVLAAYWLLLFMLSA